MNLSKLEEKLHHVFADKALVERACTHRSRGRENNERLEFLGDVVLSAVISEHLYRYESELDEGELTRRRAMLVRGKALTEIAQSIGLGAHLYLGDSESAAGRGRASILEDAMEAVIAAVYLDGGWAAATVVILHLWQDKFQEKLEGVEKDAKTQLQEWLQAKSLALPVYEMDVAGPGHRQVFTVTCRIVGVDAAYSGRGRTKREAEQVAAKKMQLHLEKK